MAKYAVTVEYSVGCVQIVEASSIQHAEKIALEADWNYESEFSTDLGATNIEIVDGQISMFDE